MALRQLYDLNNRNRSDHYDMKLRGGTRTVKLLKKMWADPVWSKVIGGLITSLIIGGLGLLWLGLTNRLHDWAAALWSALFISVPLWVVTSFVVLLCVIVLALRKPSKADGFLPAGPSRLSIVHADYQAIEGGGKVFDVTECLRAKTELNSLFLEIENHNFTVGSKNYVPDDPKPSKEKRLQVTYSLDGGPQYSIERVEHQRLVLPEEEPEVLTSLRIELFSIRRDLLHFLQEIGDEPKVDGDGPEALASFFGAKNTYLARNKARFENRFKERLVRANRRLISEMDIIDREFEVAFNSTCTPQMVKKLIDLIWTIAGKLDVKPG